MAKFTNFFLSMVADRLTYSDWCILVRMPCPVEDIDVSVDDLIKHGLVSIEKKFVFFGPKVYRTTELTQALYDNNLAKI